MNSTAERVATCIGIRRTRGGSGRLARRALLLAAGTLIGLPTAAAVTEDSVQVQIWAIRATKANDDISPELKSLAEKLKTDFKFKGYKLERKKNGTVKKGDTFKTDLIGAYSATVTLEDVKGSSITLKLELFEQREGKRVKRLGTTLKLSAGKAQLVGGPQLGKGDVLILAVSAR